MQFSFSELLTLAPELFVLTMASIILVVEAFVGRERPQLGYRLTQATLVVAAVISWSMLDTASELAFGAWYSGSPFLGDLGELPPGEGGLNPFAGYFFVWHSHAEKELTTFDIFPGGTLSAVVVLPPDVPID